MQLQNAPAAVLLLVVIGIVAAVGARITDDLATNIGQGTYTQNVSYAAAQNATLGIGEFAGFLPIIGLVIAAAIVIGLVVMAFAFSQ